MLSFVKDNVLLQQCVVVVMPWQMLLVVLGSFLGIFSALLTCIFMLSPAISCHVFVLSLHPCLTACVHDHILKLCERDILQIVCDILQTACVNFTHVTTQVHLGIKIN